MLSMHGKYVKIMSCAWVTFRCGSPPNELKLGRMADVLTSGRCFTIHPMICVVVMVEFLCKRPQPGNSEHKWNRHLPSIYQCPSRHLHGALDALQMPWRCSLIPQSQANDLQTRQVMWQIPRRNFHQNSSTRCLFYNWGKCDWGIIQWEYCTALPAQSH